MSPTNPPNYPVIAGRLIFTAAFAALAGRTWQCLVWDIPLRSVLWDETWMKGPLSRWTNWTWEEYLTSPGVDLGIERIIIGIGLALLLACLGSLSLAVLGPGPGLRHNAPQAARAFEKAILKVSKPLVVLGSLLLLLIALLIYKEKFFWTAQLLEYSLQVSAPLFLLLWHRQGRDSSHTRLYVWMKLAVSLTFISHGLFAIGFYPRPGHFVQMAMDGLWLSEESAVQFLNIAALLDFIVGIGIWVLHKDLHKPLLWYAFVWGLLTTLARLWANWLPEDPRTSFSLWTYEAIYRIPHFLIPLAMIYLIKLGQLVHPSPSKAFEKAA